jgi:hypothetical protein
MIKTTVLSAILAASAMASTYEMTFIDVGADPNNGVAYVGPYNCAIDGVPVPCTCTTWNIEVASTWTIDLVPINSLTGQELIDYSKDEWLDQQFATSSDWVGITQAIWDESGAGYSDPDTLSWLAAAAANYGGTNLTGAYVAFPVPLDSSQVMLTNNPLPEGNSATLALIGLVLVVASRKFAWR